MSFFEVAPKWNAFIGLFSRSFHSLNKNNTSSYTSDVHSLAFGVAVMSLLRASLLDSVPKIPP
jgi:hypothetical protein